MFLIPFQVICLFQDGRIGMEGKSIEPIDGLSGSAEECAITASLEYEGAIGITFSPAYDNQEYSICNIILGSMCNPNEDECLIKETNDSSVSCFLAGKFLSLPKISFMIEILSFFTVD